MQPIEIFSIVMESVLYWIMEDLLVHGNYCNSFTKIINLRTTIVVISTVFSNIYKMVSSVIKMYQIMKVPLVCLYRESGSAAKMKPFKIKVVAPAEALFLCDLKI